MENKCFPSVETCFKECFPLKKKDIKNMEGWFDPEPNIIVLVIDNIDSKIDFLLAQTILNESIKSRSI